MVIFKEAPRTYKVLFIVAGLLALATLSSLRHFSAPLLWGGGLLSFLFMTNKASFYHSFLNAWTSPIFITLSGVLILSGLSTFWSITPQATFILALPNTATLSLVVYFMTLSQEIPFAKYNGFFRGLTVICFIGFIAVLAQSYFGVSFKTILGYKWSTLKPNCALLIIMSLPLACYYALQKRAVLIPGSLLLLGILLAFVLGYQAGFYGLLLGLFAGGLAYQFPYRFPWICASFSVVYTLSLPFLAKAILSSLNLFALWDTCTLSSFIHRLAIWQFTADKIFEKPFLGWGVGISRALPGGKDFFQPGTEFLPSHPHNHILQMWLELGVAGALVLAFLQFLLVREIAKLPSKGATACAMIFYGTVFVILQLSHNVWHHWWITWVGACSVLLWRTLIQPTLSLEK